MRDVRNLLYIRSKKHLYPLNQRYLLFLVDETRDPKERFIMLLILIPYRVKQCPESTKWCLQTRKSRGLYLIYSVVPLACEQPSNTKHMLP